MQNTKDVKWALDFAHTEVSFKVKHLMISNTKGSFKTFDANIHTTGKDFTTAQIFFWIDVDSVHTNDESRDTHLKSADFFDIHNHKQITFTSTTIEKANEEGIHELWGELTMKDITKVICLTVKFGGIIKDHNGNEKAGFTVKGKINRKDWGLEWNKTIEYGGIMVGDIITIMCEIELDNVTNKEENIVLEEDVLEAIID
jgi:polyisoprenoid-binding protein YceI